MSIFTASQRKISSIEEAKKNLAPEFFRQDDTPRLIVGENGAIMFGNDAFKLLCDVQHEIEGFRITDLFIFDQQEQFFCEGLQKITLAGTGEEFLFQFDWLNLPGRDSVLVLSAETLNAREKLRDFVEEKIGEKQRDLTPFADMSADCHMISDLGGHITSINKHFETLFGYHDGEIAGLCLVDLVHYEDKAEFRNTMRSLREEGTEDLDIIFKTRCLRKNDDILWVVWTHRKVGEQIYSIARNITERENYKAALEHQQQQLNEAEAIGHIGQWEWRVGGEDVIFSAQLYTIFGLEPDGPLPTLNTLNHMVYLRDKSRMMQVFQRAIIEQNSYEVDFRIKRPDGGIRYIRCEGRCKADMDDDVVALYGIMQDVTDTMLRERDLVQAKESAERAYAAKTQFLANMSHELRTPLNAVIGFSEMMERQLLGPLGNEKYVEYITGIRKSGEHLLDLISDILDMSKIEAGKYDLSLEKINVVKTARLAIHMVEGRTVNNNVKLQIEVDNENTNMVADRRAVMQIILNLLSNAVKFSKYGGLVQLKIRQNGNFVFIIVKDQGIGIPADKLATITEPFEQVESHYTREYEGTGLGLAITKELTELHGGALKISSVVGEGTEVIVRLPIDCSLDN
jgi:two-component system cell cycle sensor histidine kinase PleC